MIVVADSTILIGLAKLGQLTLLKEIFSKVSIPEEVYKEVVERGKDKTGSKLISESPWVETRAVKDKTEVSFLKVKPLINELVTKKFRISDRVIEQALKKAGEEL